VIGTAITIAVTDLLHKQADPLNLNGNGFDQLEYTHTQYDFVKKKLIREKERNILLKHLMAKPSQLQLIY
jgi:hypothetical protein